MNRRRNHLGLVLLTALSLGASACATKGGGGGLGKGKSQAEIDAERKEIAGKAEAAGFLELANRDLANGRFVSAKRQAEQALEKNPEDADAYAVIGAAEWRAGNFDASTQAFETALQKDPKNFGAIDGLGRNMQAAGDHARNLELQDVLIANETAGFKETKCDEEGACEVGVCDAGTNMCKPPMQIQPRLNKLWSQYLMLDIDAAVKTVDEINLGVGDQSQLGLVSAYAAFVRPLEGKGPFAVVEGTKGGSDLQLDMNLGVKHMSASVGGEYARTIIFELQDECRVDTELAKTLKLPEIGKVTPVGMTEEMPIVLVPEVKVGKGEITIKNVPAIVQDLSIYEAGLGERPGFVMGRQLMQKFGSITFDFPAGNVEFSTEAAPPAGAVEQPLLMLDLHVLHVPATPISIDDSDHKIWSWIGGIYKAGVTVTGKSYLKSQHRPMEIDPPDDEAQGLKMVFIDSVSVGDKKVPGGGGLVLTNTPPDQGLADVLGATAFELGGYLNVALLNTWVVSYSLPEGKIYIKPSEG